MVIVSTKTFSARDPDHRAITKPIEMISNRPPDKTSSNVGSITVLTAAGVNAREDEVQHLFTEAGDGLHVEALGDVPDGAGQTEDQRRQRQDREERGLGREAGHPIADRTTDRVRRQPPGCPAEAADAVGQPGQPLRSARGGHSSSLRSSAVLPVVAVPQEVGESRPLRYTRIPDREPRRR